MLWPVFVCLGSRGDNIIRWPEGGPNGTGSPPRLSLPRHSHAWLLRCHRRGGAEPLRPGRRRRVAAVDAA